MLSDKKVYDAQDCIDRLYNPREYPEDDLYYLSRSPDCYSAAEYVGSKP